MGLVACALTFSGMLALVAALWPVNRIRKRLPDPTLIRAWYLLFLFIAVFIAGYIGFLVLSCKAHQPTGELLVPVIFFFGGIFVFIVCMLFDATAAGFVRCKRLEQENITDPLTGTYNRRHMQACLERQAAYARRNRDALSFLLIDLDHFKSINDTYGHLCGDRVLREISDLIATVVKREIDMIFRYGGEEFLVILPQTELEDTMILAGEICQQVAARPFQLTCRGRDILVECSVSIGAGQYRPDEEDIADCLDRVDTNLYKAKDQGRNCVVG